MKRVATIVEQNENLVMISQDLKNCVVDDSNIVNNIITGDKAWVYDYDSETNFQSSH